MREIILGYNGTDMRDDKITAALKEDGKYINTVTFPRWLTNNPSLCEKYIYMKLFKLSPKVFAKRSLPSHH